MSSASATWCAGWASRNRDYWASPPPGFASVGHPLAASPAGAFFAPFDRVGFGPRPCRGLGSIPPGPDHRPGLADLQLDCPPPPSWRSSLSSSSLSPSSARAPRPCRAEGARGGGRGKEGANSPLLHVAFHDVLRDYTTYLNAKFPLRAWPIFLLPNVDWNRLILSPDDIKRWAATVLSMVTANSLSVQLRSWTCYCIVGSSYVLCPNQQRPSCDHGYSKQPD